MTNETEYLEVWRFLFGYSKFDAQDLPVKIYLEDKDEAAGRRALVSLLRSSQTLPQELRELLASLFDEDDQKWPFVDRKLILKFRHRGRRENGARSTRVGDYVRKLVISGLKHEAAFASASARFGLSRSQVLNAWREFLEALTILNQYDPNDGTFKGDFKSPN